MAGRFADFVAKNRRALFGLCVTVWVSNIVLYFADVTYTAQNPIQFCSLVGGIWLLTGHQSAKAAPIDRLDR